MTVSELADKAFAEYVAIRGEGFNDAVTWHGIRFLAADIHEIGDLDFADELMDLDPYEYDSFHRALGLAKTA